MTRHPGHDFVTHEALLKTASTAAKGIRAAHPDATIIVMIGLPSSKTNPAELANQPYACEEVVFCSGDDTAVRGLLENRCDFLRNYVRNDR